MPVLSPSEQKIVNQILSQPPFSSLSSQQQNLLFEDIEFRKYNLGQRIIRPDELPSRLSLVVTGQIRLLAKSNISDEAVTLDLRGSGQLIGWVSLLRGKACEWATASKPTVVLSLRSDIFVQTIIDSREFKSNFNSMSNIHEIYAVASSVFEQSSVNANDWFTNLISNAENVVTCTSEEITSSSLSSKYNWYLSTDRIPGYPAGTLIDDGTVLPDMQEYPLPLRFLGFPLNSPKNQSNGLSSLMPTNILDAEDIPGTTLKQLGILESDHLDDEQNYPVIYGKSLVKQSLAVLEMVALTQNAPFRKDLLTKALEDNFSRQKPLSVQLLARLCELLGLNCQLGEIDVEYITSIESPAILILDNIPVVLYKSDFNYFTFGHPLKGICKVDIESFKSNFDSKVYFALPRRIGSTPTSRFGWDWFIPLVIKYKKALSLVFIASLLAQLFGLAIPLLIQQIIDKVLSQGNLSSLNVLGFVMVILALFKGVLMALRMYIFVDTTDRMDLTLGSAVIDRLLGLPLSFFEKRPVGELSQRIGELNNIRGFLTGTALVSILNIVFATLYLAVMLVYSPLLTAVALSTLPLYFFLVFGVAPIYKSITRKRAVCQARTQSHLIEVLGGIQTVKAQHFELTARWKWQERYRDFVNYGFRSAALSATTGEIGQFLNQVSGLLVLWVGMWQVLEGNLTLGMLIAFRIISGNVTGPLLQLSGLYQGFQKVQISMERLADIIDSNPELTSELELQQIALPPIIGNIKFENVSFRFSQKGPNQVDNVSLEIKSGDFVGIVGESGSGKSTLVKLLPRLYDVESGRIFIDDYDISKVNLSSLRRQIGIVPQDSLLFEGTIGENIALNDPDASDEKIIEAAKIACAHDFIMGLGNGYATQLSERGSNLSGGQRQRIAIARTVLANPQLLIMDEATSALDFNTEKQLCQNLQIWSENRTVLFITHRLNTIRNSNLILVMDGGRLVEEGEHQRLMSLNQKYSTLFKQQGG